MSISIYWKNQSRMKSGFPLPVTSNIFECISLKSWKDKLLLSHPSNKTHFGSNGEVTVLCQNCQAPAPSAQFRTGFFDGFELQTANRVLLSTFCWHILRLLSFCDIGHTWEGRVHVAPGPPASSEENNKNGYLGKGYRQQRMCRAILLLPSSAA